MLKYIEDIKIKFNSTDEKHLKNKIKDELYIEKKRCEIIMHQYSIRQEKYWKDFSEIIYHEREIIKAINEILYK